MKQYVDRIWPLAVLLLVVLLWHWPGTLAGRVPGEGMATLGDLPLFSFVARAIESGRVPLWNELAGFGSPLLAEGQIGVLSPPHRLLLGLLESRTAFVVSLVGHTALAGWLTCCCARGLGQSRAAALLAGLAFCGQGFFMARADHAWAWTTACWLPLIVLATWRWMQHGGWSWPVLLAGGLGLQLLAGHFQVAFFTMTIVLVIAVAIGIRTVRTDPVQRRRSAGRGALVVLAIASGLVLASAQLVPTAELLQRADQRGRGPAYLQSYSLPPAHLLVNHLAPGSLSGHPSAEPLLWVPFRSSSREGLCYVGLLPWILALWTMVACRKDRDVKLLCGLLILGLLFSLGRFLPGSGLLRALPGFDRFAAPARWSVVSGLFWALLAGRGLDEMSLAAIQRWSRRFVVAVPLLVISGLVVIALSASDDAAGQKLPRVFDQVRTMLPGLAPLAMNLAVLGLLASGVLAGILTSRRRWIGLAVVWVALDLGWTGGLLRAMTWEPRVDPVRQSPVLGSIAQRKGERVTGSLGNTPMAMGIAVFTNDGVPDMDRYWENWVAPKERLWKRTLATVPVATRWNDMAIRLQNTPRFMDRDDIEFLRLGGIRTLVGSFDSESTDKDFPLRPAETIRDEWLTRQYFGSDLATTFLPDATWFRWELDEQVVSARGWLFPVENPPTAGSDPRRFRRPPPARRRMLETAVPLADIQDRGETVVIRGTATSESVMVLADLDYPGWEATLKTGGSSRRLDIEPAFGAWRSVLIPGPGTFEVIFRYRPRSYRVGLGISSTATVVWLILLLAACWQRYRATRIPGETPLP